VNVPLFFQETELKRPSKSRTSNANQESKSQKTQAEGYRKIRIQ
jgi:hypothetical protein